MPQEKPPAVHKRVMYPGSFDPFTNGHLDLVERAAALFDELIVAVAVNMEKTPLFTIEERTELIRQCVGHLPNVSVIMFQGLLVEAMTVFDAQAILRGLRAFSDFEYELQMALMNRSLKEQCETVFMMPNAKNSFVSSRMVKEVAMLRGDFAQYVPEPIFHALKKKIDGGNLK